jgi:Protein of unknown function (DUF2490)
MQLVSQPALAADEDNAIWTQFVLSGPVSGRLGVFLYAESRFGQNASRLSQIVLAAGLGLDPGHGHSLYVGYLQVNTFTAAGPAPTEHRLWQQAAYPLGSLGRIRISGRTLLEQRWFDGSDDVGVRVLQNVRFSLPVTHGGRMQGIAYGEGFFNVKNADPGARIGVDQWRGFAGINLALGEGRSLEAGYFHQDIRRRGEDRINHVMQLTFSQRLGH